VKIKDIMLKNTTSVLPDCHLREVIDIMAIHRINGIPIVNEEQKVIGFIICMFLQFFRKLYKLSYK